jgi:hypothetical protein
MRHHVPPLLRNELQPVEVTEPLQHGCYPRHQTKVYVHIYRVDGHSHHVQEAKSEV